MNNRCGGEHVGGNYMTGLHCWHVTASSVYCQEWRRVSLQCRMMWCHILLRMFWMEGHTESLPGTKINDFRLVRIQKKVILPIAKTSTAGLWNSVQDEQCLIAIVRWELCIAGCHQHSNGISLHDCQSTVQLARHKQWKGLDLKLSPEDLHWMLRVWLRTVTVQAVLRNFHFLDMIISTKVE